MNTTVNDYIINMNEAKHIVYCRFGEKFISDLQKRKHSNICQTNQPSSSLLHPYPPLILVVINNLFC